MKDLMRLFTITETDKRLIEESKHNKSLIVENVEDCEVFDFGDMTEEEFLQSIGTMPLEDAFNNLSTNYSENE